MRATRSAPDSKSRQRGIALVLTLWLTVLLTVIAGGFAYAMRSETLAARNAVSLAQARAAADGAVERAAYEMMRPRLAEAWASDGRLRTWSDGEARITATLVDESSKIDLNAAPDTLLRGLLVNVAGVEDSAAVRIVDAIADWRDPDDLRRPNGAEEADYRAASSKFLPANGPFETVGELNRVLGMTPAIFARIGDALTVHSRQPGANPSTATRDVLLAFPNATPDVVDRFLEQRRAARDAGLPIPPFPPAQALTAASIPVWRVRAQARLPDGVTFVREAVVRPSTDPRRPIVALAWLEGKPFPPPPPDPSSERRDAGRP